MQVLALAFLLKGVVVIKRSEIYICILMIIAVMLISCNQSPEAEETTGNEITGQAVATEIMRACKYPDGKFCEERCCKAEEKCDAEDHEDCGAEDVSQGKRGKLRQCIADD